MANLREQSLWEEGVYQIETSDPVMGGENGVSNRPIRQLANRTQWLKTELAKAVASIGQNKTAADQGLAGKVDKTTQVTAGAGLTGGGALGGNIQVQLGTPGKLNGTTTNWAGSNTHTHEIDKATPTVAGVAKLIDNLTAGGTDAALTAEQGKELKQLIDGISGDAVIYKAATKLDTALGLNRVVGVHDNGGGIPAGAYPYGVAVSLAGGAGRGQIYIAHTGGIWARGSYQGNTTHNWYRVDGADWSNLRGKPTTLAGYGITDAASRTDVTQAAPPGMVVYYEGTQAPPGWLKANGAAISRTVYARLFSVIGTRYGSGDGSTTFNLPDRRGDFIRCWDDGRGVDAGRAIGSDQGDAIRNITGSLDSGNSGSHQLFDVANTTGALSVSRRQWKSWTHEIGQGGMRRQRLILMPPASSPPPPKTAPATGHCSPLSKSNHQAT